MAGELIILDGAEVKLHDRMFLINYGYVTVVRIVPGNGFEVLAGNSEKFIPANGYIGDKKAVYWHNPILINPPKNVGLWGILRDMIMTFYNKLYVEGVWLGEKNWVNKNEER